MWKKTLISYLFEEGRGEMGTNTPPKVSSLHYAMGSDGQALLEMGPLCLCDQLNPLLPQVVRKELFKSSEFTQNHAAEGWEGAPLVHGPEEPHGLQ